MTGGAKSVLSTVRARVATSSILDWLRALVRRVVAFVKELFQEDQSEVPAPPA
ncbi:hypothetical protein AKJ09_01661 [Labilithrix luteola]|uniref:Uncharacterized protein n=1 Tax=Labilithrix luteola TaxID=1391654 RepID=A0A0K1PNA6_9BACT|nr:hypothetical protein AKJ09_01661 [Labilithrix luteola]